LIQSCDLGEGVPDPAVQPPSADLPAYLVPDVVADRWLERGEGSSLAFSSSRARNMPA
jgi:hypothetical protein